jgi:hypothetical protein
MVYATMPKRLAKLFNSDKSNGEIFSPPPHKFEELSLWDDGASLLSNVICAIEEVVLKKSFF